MNSGAPTFWQEEISSQITLDILAKQEGWVTPLRWENRNQTLKILEGKKRIAMSVPPPGVLLHTRYHAGSHGREPPYLSCSYTQACISLWGQAPLNMWLYQWNKKGGFTTEQLTNYFGHGFIWYPARDQNQRPEPEILSRAIFRKVRYLW